jgi:hypothetical protein
MLASHVDQGANRLMTTQRELRDDRERGIAGWIWRALVKVSERRGDKAEAEQPLRRSREVEPQRPR